MNSFQVKGLSPSGGFSQTVYLDQQYIIAAPETPLTQETISALGEWGFANVLCDGEPVEIIPAAKKANENPATDRLKTGGKDKKQEVDSFFVSLTQFVEKLFVEAAENEKIRFDTVIEKIRNSYSFLRENRSFIMQEMRYTDTGEENHRAFHSARTAVIAINTGIYLNLPQYQRIDLGVAGLVHDIGLTNIGTAIPPRIFEKGREITETERKILYAHPVRGYSILKASNFPPAITNAIIEHHEREDGSGYPRKITGNKISPYGKIIALACSYEELSAKRSGRESDNGYTQTEDLLKNQKKLYDETVVRALVNSLIPKKIG